MKESDNVEEFYSITSWGNNNADDIQTIESTTLTWAGNDVNISSNPFIEQHSQQTIQAVCIISSVFCYSELSSLHCDPLRS